MNKMYLVGGVIVVGAIAAYLVLSQKETVPPLAVTENTTTEEDMMNMGSMKMRHSLRELISMGSAQKCTFASESANGSVSGVSYIAGGKVRTDSTVTSAQSAMTSSMIMDGTFLYTWGSAAPTGMKMSLDTLDAMKNTTGAENPSRQNADLDQAQDYDCTSWSVDTSVFVPPATVTFQNYDDMMKGVQGMMQGLGTDAGMMEGMEPMRETDIPR